MAKQCKICKQKISIEEIKEQAQNNPIRSKNIRKDYYICKALGYCINCVRAKQENKDYLKEAAAHQDILKKAFKNEKALRRELGKRGLSKEQIDTELPKFKHLIK